MTRQHAEDRTEFDITVRAQVARGLLTAAVALGLAALTLYAYRGLPERPFAADDYQWLLNVRDLDFRALINTAFDASAQSHFYRPLVWLLFWGQVQVFGLDPHGYHAVSLGLHLLNALLLGLLVYRLIVHCRLPMLEQNPAANHITIVVALVAGGIVALHPAIFEAVVWVSAQSELLAATLLLLMLHLWLLGANDTRQIENAARGLVYGRIRKLRPAIQHPTSNIQHRMTWAWHPWVVTATVALGLALLAKESAVIGLALLVLLGFRGVNDRTSGRALQRACLTPYLLPTLLSLAYVWLQVGIERRNYLLQAGGYGFGPQLVLNPLRSLALLVAPLPGSEHADAAWLIPAGAAVALVLLLWMLAGWFWRPARAAAVPSLKWNLALALTLLPTAPFLSPPDSRYLYLPVLAIAGLLVWAAYAIYRLVGRQTDAQRPASIISWSIGTLLMLVVFFLGRFAVAELAAREGRFAAGNGPGGSLWRLTTALCAQTPLDRVIVVDPPLAPPHAEAIVHLACGGDVRPKIVGRAEVDRARKGHAVVIAFPNGSAAVEPPK